MSAAYSTILTRLALEPGQSLLDVGCGAGLFASMASERGLRVSGIDASHEMLAIARERVRSADLRVGDLENLPFPDRSFDVVTGFNAFQFAANPVAALSAASRAARRGAPVVVALWGRHEGAEASAVFAALARLLEGARAASSKATTLAGEGGLQQFAEDGGLVGPFEVAHANTEWSYPSLAIAIRGLNSAGSARLTADQVGVEAMTRAHEAALQPHVKADGTVRLGAVFRYIIGRAP